MTKYVNNVKALLAINIEAINWDLVTNQILSVSEYVKICVNRILK